MVGLWTAALAPRLDQLGRDYIYTANNQQGIRAYDISTVSAPVEIQNFPNSTYGNWHAINLEQDSNFLYASIGGIFSAAGATPTQATGLAIFDVSDPTTMFMTSYWDSIDIYQGTAITKIVGDYAFLGGMEEGLVILNVADPFNISFVSQFVPDTTFPSIPVPGGTVPNARGMWVENDLVYLAYDRGGFRIIDVSDVFNPFEVSQHVNPDLDLVAGKAYNNVEVRNGIAYLPVDYCGLDVVDVSTPSAPVSIGWYNPWGCTFFNWIGAEGHTNELEFLNDSILLMTGGHHDVMAINVSDPTNPQLVGGFGDHLDSLVAWGLDIQGSRVAVGYLDNPTNIPYDSKWGGFKILDWSISTSVEESQLQAIEVYPNPSVDVVNFKNVPANTEYQLFSTIGAIVASGQIEHSMRFNVEEGLYILQLSKGEATSSVKLMIR